MLYRFSTLERQMESNSIKIIACFDITGRGLLTELQHSKSGIPPNATLTNPDTEESWIVKKRVLSDTLLVAGVETFFDCEIEFEQISHSYENENDRQIAVDRELEKRKRGIYWYLLIPKNRKQRTKPELGSILKLKTAPQQDAVAKSTDEED